MALLSENGIAVVATHLAVDFNLDTDLTLYIVSASKLFTPFAVLITNATADLSSSVVSFGQATNKTEFVGNRTLSGINGIGDAGWIMPTPADTINSIVMYTAGEAFIMDRVTAAGGAALADLYVFGFIADA